MKLYRGQENIFSAFRIEKELEKALRPTVWLKNGAYLVIEQTEALTVIDVNTGKFTGKANLQETVRKTNLEAAKEIAYQLRQRDISGMILIDFIDMKREEDREQVMTVFGKALKHDRTKTKLHGFTALGLVEMTRKKRCVKTLGQACKSLARRAKGTGRSCLMRRRPLKLSVPYGSIKVWNRRHLF